MPALDDWVKVEDRNVVLVWKCTYEDCECDHEEYEFYPSWAQNNGTPICSDGLDMTYIETRVKISEIENIA